MPTELRMRGFRPGLVVADPGPMLAVDTARHAAVENLTVENMHEHNQCLFKACMPQCVESAVPQPTAGQGLPVEAFSVLQCTHPAHLVRSLAPCK
jgi:hypothetical protein